jgi:polygalacturonase
MMFAALPAIRWWVALSATLGLARSASAQAFAYDDAGNYQKSANWTNTSNQGFGFGPWAFSTSGPGSHGFYLNNGYAIRSVTNVAGTAYTNCSWGIYANGSGGNKTVAFRGFAATNSLSTNTPFKLQWMSEGIGNASTNLAGFVLRHGNATNGVTDYTNGARFQYYFAAGGANSCLVWDGDGVTNLGVPFASGGGPSTGMNCEFMLESADTYQFVVRSATNSAVLAALGGRHLAGSGTIDSTALFDFQTSADNNFNRMQIVAATSIAPLILNVVPANHAIFVNPAASNVSFEADSPNSTIAGTNVTLTLNGVLQNLAFNTNGPTQQLLVTNTTPLATNAQYSATIIAVDANGNAATNTFTFNTAQTNSLWYDVRNYGATGDGVTRDTAAIQAAINAAAPGGVIWLHNGTYLSGTITLKDNLTFYLDPTAVLLGSGSVADYPDLNPPLSNSQTSNCKKALLFAQSSANVTITGGGTINGNGRANFTSGVEATRPISLWTALCTNVSIHDLNIVDAAMWTLVNMQSDFLTISNVSINDDNLNGNRDGCDVVDCWHVTIANCTIDSGDDSICLKSGNARGVNDLLVKNCTITKSQSNGLKFGTASTGLLTNITFQDCTVLNTSHSAMAVESVDGGTIRAVTFQRITFAGCQNAIFIILGSRSGAAVGSVDGITFRNITGSAMTDTRGCPISGCLTNGVTYRLKNLLFDNVNISFKGGATSVPAAPPEYVGQYPENTMWGNLPAYGYYVRHATGVLFTNCFTSAASNDSRPWLATSDVTGLSIVGPTLRILQGTQAAVLLWDNGFTLQAATGATGLYQDLSGASSPYTNPFTSSPQRFFRLRQ